MPPSLPTAFQGQVALALVKGDMNAGPYLDQAKRDGTGG